MRNLNPITPEVVQSAFDFVAEKSQSKINFIELCYRVSPKGINTLVGFNLQSSRGTILMTAGGSDSILRDFKLMGDREINIFTPAMGTKIVYSYCSTKWSFDDEVKYQETRGNRLQVTPTHAQGVAFENSVYMEVMMGYNSISDEPEVIDLRLISEDTKRLVDLITVCDHVYLRDQEGPQFEFGRQRFSGQGIIDYLCKND